jgi:hypothetical protein
MVTSISDSQSSNILAGLAPQQTTPSGSKDSFIEQLTSALEGYLAQSGSDSNLEIDIQKTQSQDSGVRQFLVTVKNPDSAPGQTTAAASPAASTDASTATFPGFVSIPASPSAATTTGATAGTSGNTAANNTTPAASTMTEVDAYWAAQPPAVQQLRNITDLAGRSAMAQQLADQGYTIDKAIMVWGWDPMKTMQTRQMYGYTWAPSWNQGNVSTPGLTLPGQTAYDPNHAPTGSIAVNTDFANGPGITNPWA